MKNSRVDLRLPQQRKDAWQLAAARRGLDLTQLIEQAVELYLGLDADMIEVLRERAAEEAVAA